MYKLYISKLNPKSDRLWQKPRQGYLHYMHETWYEKRHVGEKTIQSFMKNLSEAAKLGANDYTNHSIRATCIGTLDDEGFEARHITALSSHKSESTIKTYSTKCPDSKKREMYNALNASVVPKKPCVAEQENANTDTNDGKQMNTINQNDLQDLSIGMNTNNNNNSDVNLPTNFDLMPFEDDENDDFLLQYLRDNPEKEQMETPKENSKQVMNTSRTTNTLSTSMPIAPKMLFQNSNVTINYNFNK